MMRLQEPIQESGIWRSLMDEQTAKSSEKQWKTTAKTVENNEAQADIVRPDWKHDEAEEKN
jgi:hypothetical protein